jgi:hypothetical protein
MRGANGHWLLGFTSMVDNRGPGALWITAHRSGRSAVMHVRQRIHLADGGVRTLPASGELRYTNAPPHHHWHYLGFDRYELRRARTFALVVRDRKSGFCIADHYGLAPGMRHGPSHLLGSCTQFEPRRATSKRDRPSATPTAIPRSSTGKPSISRRCGRPSTGSYTAPTRTSTCAKSTTATTSRRSSCASRGTQACRKERC